MRQPFSSTENILNVFSVFRESQKQIFLTQLFPLTYNLRVFFHTSFFQKYDLVFAEQKENNTNLSRGERGKMTTLSVRVFFLNSVIGLNKFN